MQSIKKLKHMLIEKLIQSLIIPTNRVKESRHCLTVDENGDQVIKRRVRSPLSAD